MSKLCKFILIVLLLGPGSVAATRFCWSSPNPLKAVHQNGMFVIHEKPSAFNFIDSSAVIFHINRICNNVSVIRTLRSDGSEKFKISSTAGCAPKVARWMDYAILDSEKTRFTTFFMGQPYQVYTSEACYRGRLRG